MIHENSIILILTWILNAHTHYTVTIGPHSNLTVRTALGGNATFTCIRSSGSYTDSWHYQPHNIDELFSIEGLLFRTNFPHIEPRMSSAQDENHQLFSLTLINVTVSENNSLIICQSKGDFCTLHPMQPFKLVVEHTHTENTATADIATEETTTTTADTATEETTTTTEITDKTTTTNISPESRTTDEECPARCYEITSILVGMTDARVSSNSTALPSLVYYILGPAAVIIAVETITLCICFMLYCKRSKKRDHHDLYPINETTSTSPYSPGPSDELQPKLALNIDAINPLFLPNQNHVQTERSPKEIEAPLPPVEGLTTGVSHTTFKPPPASEVQATGEENSVIFHNLDVTDPDGPH